MKIDPRKMVVYRTNEFLTVVAGNKHRRFSLKELGSEMINSIYEAALAFKRDPNNPENEEALQQYLDPNYRMKCAHGTSQDARGNLYLDEMPHIPVEPTVAALVREYLEADLDITPVLNFWKLSLDNPNDQSRKDLMSYVERFGIPITDTGYMILYKAVRDKNEVIEKLAYFVGQEFFEMKRQKKNPADYNVYERPDDKSLESVLPKFLIREVHEGDSEGVVTIESIPQLDPLEEPEEGYEVWWSNSPDDEDECPNELQGPDGIFDTYDEALEALIEFGGSIFDRHTAITEVSRLRPKSTSVSIHPTGNLAELFRELVLEKQDLEPDARDIQPLWEPYHRGTHGMEIRLGEVVTMPRENCDSDISRECSYGLHVGSYEYVKSFGSSDGTVLACLVNPRDIVALPQYDHSKIRCCAYLPYGIIKKDAHGNWDEAETTHWEEAFIDYEKAELEKRIEELQEQAKDKSAPDAHRTEELLNLVKNRLQKIQS